MTPTTINEKVKQILKLLKAEFDPEYVEFRAEPNYIELDCFINVEKKVSQDGGKIVYGWTIWEHKYFIEAEFHAVWENDDEDLIDITPKANQATRILFVPDDRVLYDGRQIKNIRLNTSKNPLVNDLIIICDAYFQITNSGKLAYEHGDITEFLTQSQKEDIAFLNLVKNITLALLQEDGTIEDLCKCNSSKRFKNCHGKDLGKRFT
jgi:hypothetical protein